MIANHYGPTAEPLALEISQTLDWALDKLSPRGCIKAIGYSIEEKPGGPGHWTHPDDYKPKTPLARAPYRTV